MESWIATALLQLQAEYNAAVERALETHTTRFLAIADDDEAKRQRDALANLLEDFRTYAEASQEGGAK